MMKLPGNFNNPRAEEKDWTWNKEYNGRHTEEKQEYPLNILLVNDKNFIIVCKKIFA